MRKLEAIELAYKHTLEDGEDWSVFRDLTPQWPMTAETPYYCAPAEQIPHQTEDWGALLVVTFNADGSVEWER